MKLIAIAFAIICALLAPAASAVTLEEDYLAARDRYVADFKTPKKGRSPAALAKAQRAALAALEQRLRKIVGAVAIPDFAPEGKINLDTLSDEDQGFGMLDALRFSATDGLRSIIVTSDGLLAQWIKAHPDLGAEAQGPNGVATALRSDVFYTQATNPDAAVVLYGDLPIKPPPGADAAYAMLAAHTQAEAPASPDTLIVTLRHKQRVLISIGPIGWKIAPIEDCNAVRADFEKKAQEAMAAYQTSEPKDASLAATSERLNGEAETAFLKCFRARAAVEYFSKAPRAKSQALANELARQ
jgi:hypothetical protein